MEIVYPPTYGVSGNYQPIINSSTSVSAGALSETSNTNTGNDVITGNLTVSGITTCTTFIQSGTSTWTGNSTQTGNDTVSGILQANQFTNPQVIATTANSSTATVNFAGGNFQILNLTTPSGCIVTLSGYTSMSTLLLEVVNTSSGTCTFSGLAGLKVRYPGGTAPTITTSGTDYISFAYDGTHLDASFVQALS